MNLIVLALIIFIVTLTVDIITDLNITKVKHFRGALLRCIGLIPATILLGWPKWELMVYAGIMICFVYWTLFDGIYSICRNFGFFHTGSDDEDDAVSDNFLQAIPLWLHITIKIGGILASTWWYLYNVVR